MANSRINAANGSLKVEADNPDRAQRGKRAHAAIMRLRIALAQLAPRLHPLDSSLVVDDNHGTRRSWTPRRDAVPIRRLSTTAGAVFFVMTTRCDSPQRKKET